MDNTTSDFVHAGSLEGLRAKGRLVVHGRHRPVLLMQEGGQVFACHPRPLRRGCRAAGLAGGL